MKIFAIIIRCILCLLFSPLALILCLVMNLSRFLYVLYAALVLELYRDTDIDRKDKIRMKYDMIYELCISNREMAVINEASGYITRIKRELTSDTE